MKTIFHSLVATVAACWLAAAPAQGQTFSNSNLDTWATRTTSVIPGVDAPTNWQTTDDLVSVIVEQRLPSSTGTVTKASTPRSGPFAAQLQTRNVGTGRVPGFLILGTNLNGGNDLPGGMPFTARPTSLQFYYQLSGPQALADSAGVLVQLTRTVNGSSVVVAQAAYLIPALATTYTLATVPLTYRSALAPDSVSMVLSSGFADNITNGTTLLVDDIAFVGGTVTATRDAALAATISVFPNPSPNGRYVLNASEPALLAAPLTVLDATGRVVRREPSPGAGTTRTLDLSELAKGVYTVQLATAKGLIAKRIVVQ
ncbi:T9SS type A sorting domain-containing protein [Hymenobacter sp. B1770]|uniref:T9SS type A sorting domain-containing protein n=1 Tax=Hymenobacter sp. B1770 TaxID=1718788 RepID=UPI003CF883D1